MKILLALSLLLSLIDPSTANGSVRGVARHQKKDDETEVVKSVAAPKLDASTLVASPKPQLVAPNIVAKPGQEVPRDPAVDPSIDNNAADGEEPLGDESKVVSEEEAKLTDINLIAETFRWDTKTAAAYMELQDSFGKLVGFLEAKEDLFSDSEMPEKLGEPVKLYLKGGLQKVDTEMIEKFQNKHRVKVEIIETRYSRKEQERRAEVITEKLTRLNFQDVGYAINGDMIEIDAAKPQDRDDIKPTPASMDDGDDDDEDTYEPGQVDEVAAKILNVDSSELYGIVLLIHEGEELEGDFHTRGGRRINSASSQCTTGFSVTSISSGVDGITTAAHCTGMNTYDAESPESDYPTFFQGQHNGNWGDFEWHTTNHLELAQYWANRPSTGDRRSVTAVDGSFSKGDVVCGYSRRKGNRYCDRIYRTCVRQGGTRRLIAMKRSNMTGGDSGGPWSYGTKASGLVKGWKRIWFRKRDTWSRASYMPIALGVAVKTV